MNKSINFYLKEFANANILAILIFLVHGLILYVIGNAWYGDDVVTFFLQNQLFSVVIYLTNTSIIRYFRERYKGGFWNVKALFYAVGLNIIATLICIFFIRLFFIVVIYEKSFDEFIVNEGVEGYKIPFIITAIATSFFYGAYYWKSKQDSKVKESKIIAGAASAKFNALKNQLDPHFLFNSLNVLASLIEENPTQAQKFTTSLSKVYRYVLEQKNKELVSLDEELAFARTYMRLIKMRFEDSIEVVIPEKATDSNFKVVPLSLQLLLENAVKHNQVNPSKKLHITIYEKGNRLFVKNNIQEKQVIKKSSGVGLANIKERYRLLSNNEVTILNDDTYFNVGVPILTSAEQVDFEPKQIDYIENKRYERAKQKVDDLKGFYVHLAIYLIFVPVFIYFNVKSTSFPWALFPILGWGWGVLSHASETFGWHPVLNKEWEKRKIEKYMEDENF